MGKSTAKTKITTKKVGADELVAETGETASQKRRRERKNRPVFDLTMALGVDGKPVALENVADEGEPSNLRLVGPATNWTSDYAPLKRSHFVDKSAFFEHKAVLAEQVAVAATERAAELREMANESRSGTPSIKRQQKALAKRVAEMEKLKAELAAQGFDVDGFMAGLSSTDDEA